MRVAPVLKDAAGLSATNVAPLFDDALIRRHDRAGPRYTSYPTAVQFHDGYDERAYAAAAKRSNEAGAPLSLYFHLPFCATVCFYCACNKIVTNNRRHAVPYLEHLCREIELQSTLLDTDRTVDQLHWGGGTPTFFSDEQMRVLMTKTRQCFKLRDDAQGEYSIEIDPRETNPTTVETLWEIGFNRLSLGVQDFDPAVQRAVNRIQSEAETVAVIEAARAVGFRSVSVDLIYGLPLQTVASFATTVERVVAASPDRVSVFNYAHLPARFKSQRQIDAAALPSPTEKLDILRTTIDSLTAAGYVYIGMDHFAKPDDELALAQRERRLHRNFQGYSTHADCELVAMGITGIGSLGDSYSQNVRTVDEYYGCIEEGHLPICRGIELTADDLLRRHVISELICHFEVDKTAVAAKFGIDFDGYFAAELRRLAALMADGLVELTDTRIAVTPAGRLLVRNVCMVFDHYLVAAAEATTYSRVI